MSPIYFTRNQAPNFPGVEHRAVDWDTDTMYQAIQPQGSKGWIGRVTDVDGNVVHEIDWSDHAVHIDEMRRWLTRLHDTGELVAA